MTTSQRENYISEKHKNFDRRYKQIQVNQKKDHQPERKHFYLIHLNSIINLNMQHYMNTRLEYAVANTSLSPTPRTSQQCAVVSHMFTGPTWGSSPRSMPEGGGVEPQ